MNELPPRDAPIGHLVVRLGNLRRRRERNLASIDICRKQGYNSKMTRELVQRFRRQIDAIDNEIRTARRWLDVRRREEQSDVDRVMSRYGE